MLQAYRQHVAERAALGIPPLPLSAKQTAELIELLKQPPKGEERTLVELITHRVPAGVDDAAKVKASYLAAVAHGTEMCPLIGARARHRVAGHDARRLQPRAADRPARRSEGRRDRRRGAEEDAADVRPVPRCEGKGRQGQRQRQGRAAELGRCRVVHLAPGSAEEHHRQHLQGGRRDQHRRPVAGARRLQPPGHSAARAGDAQEPAPRHRARRRRQARPGQVHRGTARQGPPGGLRRRRGRHRLEPQVGHQLGAVVHRRRHSLRSQQALRRRVPGRQDRPDLLQHDGRFGRAADRARRAARWTWAT